MIKLLVFGELVVPGICEYDLNDVLVRVSGLKTHETSINGASLGTDRADL